MTDLMQPIAHKFKIIEEIKLQTYFKMSVQKDVTPLHVELRFSYTNIFGIWEKDFGVKSLFAS